MPNPKDLFPLFQQALRLDAESADTLPHATRYRYLKGELPKMLEWFVEHPRYLRLLADDAEALTPEKRRLFKATVAARATDQRARRERGKPKKPGKR